MIYKVISVEDGIVCIEDENNALLCLSADSFDFDVKEGYILQKIGASYTFDEELTNKRKNFVFNKMNRMFNKN